MPATMASTANAVVAVVESLTSSKGKRPVRISQRPSRIIPRFRPAKLLLVPWVLLNQKSVVSSQ